VGGDRKNGKSPPAESKKKRRGTQIMLNLGTSRKLGTLIVFLAGLVLAPFAVADDRDDVLALIQQYGELEDDLEAQARLMHPDRVFINGGVRQTDNAKNMAIQKANREAGENMNGGKTRWVATIEGPLVSIHGDTAVASFVRWFNIYPHNQAPINTGSQWVTMVLVKDGGDWQIVHTHQSPTAGN
jgi:hypothetical protein